CPTRSPASTTGRPQPGSGRQAQISKWSAGPRQGVNLYCIHTDSCSPQKFWKIFYAIYACPDFATFECVNRLIAMRGCNEQTSYKNCSCYLVLRRRFITLNELRLRSVFPAERTANPLRIRPHRLHGRNP